jgi:hypothetical protein
MIERSPFCTTCPFVDEVTGVIAPLGYTLVFQMKADTARAYRDLPPLPAQYHYEGPHGASVIYLAGKDIPILGDDDDEPASDGLRSYPEHGSRFWIAAPNAHAVLLVLRVLSRLGALKWQRGSRSTMAA